MAGRGFTPNNNRSVIRQLSSAFGRCNKGRNRILLGTVILSIVTLTMVFGISCGKVRAEYVKSVREAGTAASARIENADMSQYAAVRTLGYVEEAGRSVTVGSAEANEEAVCTMRWLDDSAWEHLIRPAYTDVHGSYPEEEQEIMLSERALEALGIGEPEEGMEIDLNVSIGLFHTAEEKFTLSGWFMDYTEKTGESAAGYVSRKKMEAWGFDVDAESDILLRQSDHLDWRETEEKLYDDVQMNDSGQRIRVSNTSAYEAVRGITGGYETAVLGALVIVSGMYFLIHNVMQISMAGDVRQLGLLNTVGTTEKQMRKIYYGQIFKILVPGVLIGSGLSAVLLLAVIPGILGAQYLNGYGGANELQIFRPGILVGSVIFTVILVLAASAGVIRRTVSISCVESVNYTGLAKKQGSRKSGRKVRKDQSSPAEKSGGKKRGEPGSRKRSGAGKKRSAGMEILYMAWRNLTRQKGKFILTVFSLFLGVEAFLGALVITSEMDYTKVIEKRPDFLIAGEFSEWGKEEGYGSEYKSRDAGADPMLTEGGSLELLYDNEYDEFSPISSEVRDSLLSLDGVKQEDSYVMEGAYVYSVMSGKGVRPLESDGEYDWLENEYGGTADHSGESDDSDHSDDADDSNISDTWMVEGVEPDVVQILSDEEINALRKYAEEKQLPVDMESLANGTGVMLLHDHALSKEQEKMAEESVGEPVYFKAMMSRTERIEWNKMTPEERDVWENSAEHEEKCSENFTLCGYLDNRAEGFPDIRQTWHGSEGEWYFLISEAGFEKLPAERKTLYMELSVEEDKEPEIKNAVARIVSEENQRRAQIRETGIEEGTGEAGIFCISRSDLLAEASDYIRGNRVIFGSISAVLLSAGLTNYFNVMVTGVLSRKREFAVMESIGMTKRQKRLLIAAEGAGYWLAAGVLVLTVGNVILWLVRLYVG